MGNQGKEPYVRSLAYGRLRRFGERNLIAQSRSHKKDAEDWRNKDREGWISSRGKDFTVCYAVLFGFG